MRITIETGVTPHAIKVEGEYTIDELLEFLGNQYPDGTWKDLKVCDKLPTPVIQNLGLWGQIQSKNKHYWGGIDPDIKGTNPMIYGTAGNVTTGDNTISGDTHGNYRRDVEEFTKMYSSATKPKP